MFMKKYIIGITVTLFILIDIFVLLYPTVSDYFNSISQSRATARYIDDVAVMDNMEMQTILKAAREYNKILLNKVNRFEFTEEETAEYKKQLNTSHGVMGILVIDKIDVKLAIYHGTDSAVLQVGLGHMQGTSLPVGGTGTHTFITGHRGVPSATLLTDLDKMIEGDTFTLYIMGETLTYQVDNIQTVEPQEVESLNIDPDMDYCTLVTCTPYGINSHRLLVRGHRVKNAVTETIYAGARQLNKILVILIFIVPALPVFIIFFIVKCRKIHKGGTIQR